MLAERTSAYKMIQQLYTEVEKAADAEKAKLLARFFKTGKGEYGEGDVFLGIMVPEQRRIAKEFSDLSIDDAHELLMSRFHEHRLIALLVLIEKYKRASEPEKKAIYLFYLKHTARINNWDLVDLSAHRIVGPYLKDKDRSILYKLAKSKDLWERRIAVLSTFYFIDNDDFKDSLKISEMLLYDKHDLIHKAVGWMLREIGKRDKKTLLRFLDKHCKQMPRTMLRYAIERLNLVEKRFYMARET